MGETHKKKKATGGQNDTVRQAGRQAETYKHAEKMTLTDRDSMPDRQARRKQSNKHRNRHGDSDTERERQVNINIYIQTDTNSKTE